MCKERKAIAQQRQKTLSLNKEKEHYDKKIYILFVYVCGFGMP